MAKGTEISQSSGAYLFFDGYQDTLFLGYQRMGRLGLEASKVGSREANL